MKKTVKISIARFSFSIEETAYLLLEDYINKLKEFYLPLGEKDVVDGIEERIAELFIERGAKEKVVNIDMVDEVISILGKPEDIEDSSSGNEERNGATPKKRLYRDPFNKVVKGVCGGLSAYTSVDVVYVRILFAIALFFLSVGIVELLDVNIPVFFVAVLIYFGLVYIIPKAVTVEQRCQMKGVLSDVNEIRKNVMEKDYVTGNAASSNFNNVLNIIGRICGVTIGVFLILIGVLGLVGGLFGIFGVNVISSLSLWEAADFIDFNIEYPFLYMLLSVFVYVLPFVGMLYGGIMLCFNFKSPKWKPGITMFIMWIFSLVLFSFFSVVALKPYFHHNEMEEEILLTKNYDTLYVECPNIGKMDADSEFYFNAGRRSLKTYYQNNKGGKKEFVLHPKIYVKDLSGREGYKSKVVVEFNRFSKVSNMFYDCNASDVVSVKDSLLTITPKVISKENKFNGKYCNIDIYVPKETVVKVISPKSYEFPKEKRKVRK